MRNDGGHAFPVKADSEWYAGMSMLEYFAAHAPEGPLWPFEPRMATKRPEATPVPDGHDLPANYLEIRAWNDERCKQLNIQWPWVWAEAMLREKAKREAP